MISQHNFMWKLLKGSSSGASVADQLVYQETVGVASVSWSINHALDGFVLPQIYDASGYVMYPTKIVYVDSNNITVKWPVALTGSIVCVRNPTHEYSVSGADTYDINHGHGTHAAVACWANVTDPIDGLEKILVQPVSEANLSTNNTLLDFDASIDLDVVACKAKAQVSVGSGVTDFSLVHGLGSDGICIVVNSLTRVIWPDEVVLINNNQFDIEGVFSPDGTTAFFIN